MFATVLLYIPKSRRQTGQTSLEEKAAFHRPQGEIPYVALASGKAPDAGGEFNLRNSTFFRAKSSSQGLSLPGHVVKGNATQMPLSLRFLFHKMGINTDFMWLLRRLTDNIYAEPGSLVSIF